MVLNALVELEGSEKEALGLVALVTNVGLKEHYLIVGVVVVAGPGVIPISSRGEKTRMHLRNGFLADQLDPIDSAYNIYVTNQVVLWMSQPSSVILDVAN
ncbi:unnamed protein product [Boreogadus saida]